MTNEGAVLAKDGMKGVCVCVCVCVCGAHSGGKELSSTGNKKCEGSKAADS